MSSDKIDKWVDKNPESWSKLADDLNKKETFASFKKKFRKGAREKGKDKQVEAMTKAQLKKIYEASGIATTKTKFSGGDVDIKPFKPKIKQVTRKGKTYKRTFNPRYDPTTKLAFEIVSELNPRSKEFNDYVDKLVESTGRSKQAIKKKIYRTRVNQTKPL